MAGGIPGPDDPIYAYTQGRPKALIDMNGRTMLERVVDALQSSYSIEDIVVVGLGSDMGMHFRRPVHHLPDQNNLVANALAGVNWLRQQKPETKVLFLCSADIPTLTGDIVDRFIELCRPFDRAIYYSFATQATIETRFPNSKRTFVKLKDLNIAGGDVALIHADLADSHHELWQAMTNARKHAWRLARIVGLRMLLKFLFRRVSLADIETTAERLINQPAKVVLSPYAELAMDADKPQQVDLLREDLRRRSA
jgi:hypothetical protein